jgi:ParB family chromosome partitioning protein
MSIKDRLRQKSGDLSVNPAPPKQETLPGQGPRTAPGQMLAFRSAMRENNDRVAELEAKLQDYEGSIPARLIDSAKIRPSKWANRHESSFHDADFEELRSMIAAEGGNTQPIKIRPAVDDQGLYEIVFGHRRHRACLELGIPVLAIVDSLVSEQQQFVQMDQENRARKNLSAWEQGTWYKKALTDKLWPSQNAMAKALGLSQGNISSALLVADLPEVVVNAFPSPNDIQFKMARRIGEALKTNPEYVLAQAKALANDAQRSGESVAAALLAKPAAKSGGDLNVARVSVTRKGDWVTIQCTAPSLTAEREAELLAILHEFLGVEAE